MTWQLFGMEVSPYAVKVRALMRYKGIPHLWLARAKHHEATFRAHAKLPLIPLLLSPDGQTAYQDSTPILEQLETLFPERPLRLADPFLDSMSWALEESADEWTIKAMFYYRWTDSVDRQDAGRRISRASIEPGRDPQPIADRIIERLTARTPELGCGPENALVLTRYLHQTATLLEAHLQQRPYLFGGQPSLADLSLASQFYQLLSDPTPRQLLMPFTALRDWALRSMSPTDQGDTEPWAALEPTLAPLFAHEWHHYQTFAEANAAAFAENRTLACALAGRQYTQPPQKYVVKSWQQLQTRLVAQRSDPRWPTGRTQSI